MRGVRCPICFRLSAHGAPAVPQLLGLSGSLARRTSRKLSYRLTQPMRPTSRLTVDPKAWIGDYLPKARINRCAARKDISQPTAKARPRSRRRYYFRDIGRNLVTNWMPTPRSAMSSPCHNRGQPRSQPTYHREPGVRPNLSLNLAKNWLKCRETNVPYPCFGYDVKLRDRSS